MLGEEISKEQERDYTRNSSFSLDRILENCLFNHWHSGVSTRNEYDGIYHILFSLLTHLLSTYLTQTKLSLLPNSQHPYIHM